MEHFTISQDSCIIDTLVVMLFTQLDQLFFFGVEYLKLERLALSFLFISV